MKDKIEQLKKTSLALGLLLVGIFVGFFWVGYVTSVLWSWFAVPLGVPAISLFHAVGLSLLVKVLANPIKSGKNRDDMTEDQKVDDALKSLIMVITAPALVLFVAWLATLGM